LGLSAPTMSARNINHEIIEELYSEALVLADDARAAFDLRFQDNAADCNDLTRVALSIEGLRTTTRLMHVLAWLLNHRAYMAGELSDTQLEHCGTLPEERQADADNLARLEPETRALIEESERLHARVARLDRERRADIAVKMPVASLQGRIAKAFATG
jgi:regulator of CtrA degradation